MQVIATAGHVDHGKSTLVRTLTGMEPDRLAEERRRGMTIDLGFAWMTLPLGERLSFVDVPGHERFVTTMLAGIGPVAAVMFVVAADEGWRAQSTEHLAALDALTVSTGLLVVTRRDLADPGAALEQARTELRGTSLAGIEAVAVSGRTGEGMDQLVAALDRIAADLPAPAADAPVRLWIDRVFTISGAGTVVTGTLGAGTLRVGDELLAGQARVRVRGLQVLGEPVERVSGVARVAVNARAVDRVRLARGTALLTPHAWLSTALVDVRTDHPVRAGELTLHIGSAAVPVRVRPLGEHAARLRLAVELPLRIGDTALLRDPGQHRIAAGIQVLDVRPSQFRRRGTARTQAAELDEGVPDTAMLLRRHGGLLRRTELIAMGCPPTEQPVAGDWIADPEHWARLAGRLEAEVASYARTHPIDAGLPLEAARRALGLPDRGLVEALVRPPLTVAAGRISAPGGLPAPVREAVERIHTHLADRPFQAPEAQWLAEHGFSDKIIAAAARATALLHLGNGIVLRPDAATRATAALTALPQPFTASEARRALGTTRHVAIPLLEHLDAQGITRRVDDTRRVVVDRAKVS
jgi:selenocysteine-specific elongation factor